MVRAILVVFDSLSNSLSNLKECVKQIECIAQHIYRDPFRSKDFGDLRLPAMAALVSPIELAVAAS